MDVYFDGTGRDRCDNPYDEETKMKMKTLIQPKVTYTLIIILILLSLLIGSRPTMTTLAANPRVAYIYTNDPTLTANAYKTVLTNRGLDMDIFTDAEAASAVVDLSIYDAIILADDLAQTGGILSYQNIRDANKPVLGIGFGGQVFLSLVNPPVIGSGTGFANNLSDNDVHLADPYAPVWSSPNPISQLNQTMFVYFPIVSTYALSIPEPVPFATRIGRLVGYIDFYSLFSTSVNSICYSYWGYRGLPADMTPSGQNLFWNMLLGNPCAEGSYSINSALTTTPPVMDGILSYGEWSLTPNRLEMDHGFLTVMNDSLRLYILLDVLESTANNVNVSNQNDFWVTFDTNHNGIIDPAPVGNDLNYGLAEATHNMRFQHYLGPANWDFLSTSTKSSLGPGFDCFTPDGTKVLNINTQQFDCNPHQLWEIAIDLHEIGAQAGQTIRMGIRTYSPNPHYADEVPNVFDIDFSNLITVHLAVITVPPHDPNANIAFGYLPIEITQVVQDSNHSIPLIADKTTAGRISIIATNTSTPQPVIAYLYGQRGMADLPGSPLLLTLNAPLTIDRGKLTDTANFLLPASWLTSGEVTFHAEGSDYNGHSISTAGSPIWLTFNSKKVPLYWVIQENNGTADTPNLPSQATINSYESYVRAVFPVRDVTFVQKSWSVIGALNGMSNENNLALVVKYYNAISIAYWNAVIQNKVPPYDLPDIIFGVGPFSGGVADTTWFNNGSGHAGVGGNATSAEGVIAHEMNHSLDRSSNGTWGRHVGACGATGPDPNWPGGNNPADPAIKEYGFDTRQPWQNNNSSKTVVGANWPDIMSYCTSSVLPTKWISPYRYKNWASTPSFPSALMAAPINSIYISGILNSNGTGSLEPAYFAAGMPLTPSTTGAYTITLSGPGILISHSFDVFFQDIEGNPLATVPFNFVLADPGNVTGIQLRHGSDLLASISKAAVSPTADFIAPADGTLSGVTSIVWSITPGTQPVSALFQTLEFSANNGDTWIPVGINIPGIVTTYLLDTAQLPKTNDFGRLRLVISDGLNNIKVESPFIYSVGNHSPAVYIQSPIEGSFIPGSTQVILKGDASDVDEDTALPESKFLWTMDGDITLGIGRSVNAVLPNGRHTLLLSVLDSQGAIGTSSITVFRDPYQVFLPSIRR